MSVKWPKIVESHWKLEKKLGKIELKVMKFQLMVCIIVLFSTHFAHFDKIFV